MKLELRTQGFNARYVEIENASVDVKPASHGLKITAYWREQLWITWADTVSFRKDFPSYEKPEVITFPLH
jgi:hypothetical protein